MNTWTRREVIECSVKQFALFLLGAQAFARGNPPAHPLRGGSHNRELLHWEAFLDLLDKSSQSQYTFPWNQLEYVNKVSAAVARIDLNDPSLVTSLSHHGSQHDGSTFPSLEDIHRRISCQVSLLTFEKGQEIPLHDHPHMTGVLLCVRGHLKVEEFDECQQSSDGEVVLQKRDVAVLEPGAVAALTSSHKNIHRVSSAEYCQAIDIFTPPYDPQRIRNTRWFSVVPGSADPRSEFVRTVQYG